MRPSFPTPQCLQPICHPSKFPRRTERIQGAIEVGLSVRGALLTKGPDSSFAEAHKGFTSEPIHIENEMKDQEDEVEDGRDK